MAFRTPQTPFIADEYGRGVPIWPMLPPDLPFIPGNIWHVRPRYGSDVNNSGKSPASAFKTVAKAYTASIANQNDTILLYSEGSSASQGAEQLSAVMTWAKSGVHLIGVAPGGHYGVRAGIRLASAATDAASPMFTLSASNCYFRNLYFYEGAGTLFTGAVKVTGSYNTFEGCHIAGMGSAANVIANAYSLTLAGSEQNSFNRCIIGYGQQRGAYDGTAELITSGTCGRHIFKDCMFMCGTSHATYHTMVRIGANACLDFILFDNCKFTNAGVNGGGVNLTYGFVVNANPGGTIHLHYCSSAGITDWSNNCGFIWGPIFSTTADGGIGAVLVT